jgi:hypothetical protein
MYFHLTVPSTQKAFEYLTLLNLHSCTSPSPEVPVDMLYTLRAQVGAFWSNIEYYVYAAPFRGLMEIVVGLTSW